MHVLIFIDGIAVSLEKHAIDRLNYAMTHLSNLCNKSGHSHIRYEVWPPCTCPPNSKVHDFMQSYISSQQVQIARLMIRARPAKKISWTSYTLPRLEFAC